MQEFIDARWNREIVPLLCDYIRIPARSPSFDPDWERSGHIERAVQLLADWAADRPEAGSPPCT